MTATFETKIESAIETINFWYDRMNEALDANDDKAWNDFNDKYENALEYYARKLGMRESQLEDCAIDVRYLGWNRC